MYFLDLKWGITDLISFPFSSIDLVLGMELHEATKDVIVQQFGSGVILEGH